MSKKILFAILGTVVLSSGILASIIFMSNKPNDTSNGFNRTFLKAKVNPINKMKALEPIFRVCGFTNNTLFFLTKHPSRLISTDYSLAKQTVVNLSIDVSPQVMAAYDIIVDSPYINIYSGNLSLQITRGITDTTILTKKFHTPLFTRVTSISSSSLAIRGFDTTQTKQLFKKIDRNSGNIIKESAVFSEKNDAGFSTDGMLFYDSINYNLIYVPYYQNGFACLDTNLNLRYMGNTIDTMYSNSITTHSMINTQKKSGSLMPTTPLKRINRECTIGNGNLYILSTLKADNEIISDFSENSVIDIYTIGSGSYIGSFYIPHLYNTTPKSIRIIDDILVAVYPEYVATFNIDFD